MNYYEKLYISNNIKNIDKVITSLNKNISIYNIYIILVQENSNNLLYIIHSSQIFRYIYKNNYYIIIGIAKTKEKAILLTKKIIEDFYLSKNDFKIFKEYFLNIN